MPTVSVWCRTAPPRSVRAGLPRPAADMLMEMAVDGADEKQSLFYGDPVTGSSASTGCSGVLTEDYTQEDVFRAVAAPLAARSVATGCHVAVLAYGQTASGKTHTMFGAQAEQGLRGPSDPLCGVVVRTVDTLFSLEAVHGHDVAGVDIGFFEVYNETAIDHVARCHNRASAPAPPNPATKSGTRDLSHHTGGLSSAAAKGRPGELRETFRPTERSKLMRSLQRARCEDSASALETVSRLYEGRKTAATEMNVSSSRSHVVIQLSVLHRRGTSLTRGGTVTLVDLAGSESLKLAASPRQERVQESKGINVSLLALKKVVHALKTNSPYVPYKDSTLTVVLEPCLEGASTALVACVSSDAVDSGESLATIRFAAEASRLSGWRGENASKAATAVQRRAAEHEHVKNQALRSQHQTPRSQLPFRGLAPESGVVGAAHTSRPASVTAGYRGPSAETELDSSYDEDDRHGDMSTVADSSPESARCNNHLSLIASLQARVRGLSDENARVRCEKEAVQRELALCKDSTRSLLVQCERTAEDFERMREELAAARRHSEEQEAIISALRTTAVSTVSREKRSTTALRPIDNSPSATKQPKQLSSGLPPRRQPSPPSHHAAAETSPSRSMPVMRPEVVVDADGFARGIRV